MGAPGKLFEIVYDDLRALAGRHVRGARNAGPSATSLVHEAFLRIAKRGDLPYQDRTHFFAVASRAMRQIVIDDARGRNAAKRGGGKADIDFEAISVAAPAASTPTEDLLALEDALVRLEATRRGSPRLSSGTSSADSPSRRSPKRLTSRAGPCNATGAPLVPCCTSSSRAPSPSPNLNRNASPSGARRRARIAPPRGCG